MEHGRRACTAEEGEQVRRGARIAEAGGHDDQQREILDPPGEVGEDFERGSIGPLGVIDDQRQRLGASEPGAQPHETVRDRRRAAVVLGFAVERQSAAQRRLEQRPDYTEREMTLLRRRGGAAHETAG